MQRMKENPVSCRKNMRLGAYKSATEEAAFFKRMQKDLDKRLFERAGWGWINDAKALLDEGANPNARDGQFGSTALTKAAVQGHFAICKLLVERGAAVNATSKKGKATALMCAAHNGHSHVCLLLAENGANMNAKDKDGWVPLMHAGAQGHTDICDFLIRHGADVNATDKKGSTASVIAELQGKHITAVFLKKMGIIQQVVGRKNFMPFIRGFEECISGGV